jgi:CHAD domain-containing protein
MTLSPDKCVSAIAGAGMDGSFEQPPPGSSFEARLAKDISAEGAFRAVGRACVEQIQANEHVLRQTRAPEALHQIRVALRRWRTALSVFKPLLADGGDAIRAELKWLADALDEARDLDVFIVSSLGEDRRTTASAEGLMQLRQAAVRARGAAYETAAEAVGSERYRKLLWEGARTIEAPGWTLRADAPAACELVSPALARGRKAVAKAGQGLEAMDPDTRHELRIRTKKARYTAELFASMFDRPKAIRRYVKALKDLQDALGELNDIRVAQTLAMKLAQSSGSPEAGFAAGLICGSRLCREGALLADARRAYSRFADSAPFW